MALSLAKKINHFWANFIHKVSPQRSNQNRARQWLAAGCFKGRPVFLYKYPGGNKDYLCFLTADGDDFSIIQDKVVIESSDTIALERCSNFRLSNNETNLFLTFIQNDKGKKRLIYAVSSTLDRFIVEGETKYIGECAVLVPNFRRAALGSSGHHVFYFGEHNLRAGYSKDFKSWYVPDSFIARPREGFFDKSPITVMGATVTPQGILLIYDASSKSDGHYLISCGACLLSTSNPSHVIWRSEVPLFEPHLEQKSTIKPLGAVFLNGEVMLNWVSEENLLTISIPQPFFKKGLDNKHRLLTKFSRNPILAPNAGHDWESEGAFNAAAIYADSKVHLVYRAVGNKGISVFGYASSKNGFDLDVRLPHPVYFPREPFEGAGGNFTHYNEFVSSGGSWGGCEDPKLTEIEGRIYMTYVAHNGYNLPGIALTSIGKEDFLNQRWLWAKPVLISAPTTINKSACLLPEKINGKFVIFHRIYPDILIDFVSELDFGEGKWLTGQRKISPREHCWDSRKISIGAPPLKTEHGWLVIYHAVDDRDPGRYKVGAMILDLLDPSMVLYRTPHPILIPDEVYENGGKPGVVYPCGAVLVEGNLLVYYGGGDRVTCVATTLLDRLLYYLTKCPAEEPLFRKRGIRFDNLVPA